MNYIKSFKKEQKSNYKRNFFIIIVSFVILFELVSVRKNELKSEDIEVSTTYENKIEEVCKYVVGISKDNVIATGQTSLWGSGVIVSKKGFILTNAHVCGEKGSKCYVILDYENYYDGEVVWYNESLDLAFVKTNIEFKSSINIADSSNFKIGQDVYSIGNPISISFQQSVGKGIISGINRNLEFEEQGKNFYMGNLIQTDAVINYGNSGGALVDIYGNLIGINTVKISDADSMGFAIPAYVVKPIISKLEENGSFEEGSLKIWCLDKYSIQESNIKNSIESGIFVAQIDVGSNAEKAGLKVGDIITYIDTDEVNTFLELKEKIFSKEVGENVILKVLRNNKELFINVKVEKVL